MKLTSTLEARVAAAIRDGVAAIEALRVVLKAEADDPATPGMKRRLLAAADERLNEAVAAEEESWDVATDNDRLEAAFAELADHGIVAVPGAGETLSDGWEEVAEARGDDHRGAVFYHGQDEARALAGEGLLLAFGAFVAGDEAACAIGKQVAEVLRLHGLTVEWNERADTRLHVRPFTWQRRTHEPRPGLDLLICACDLEHRIRVIKACRDLLGLDFAVTRAGLGNLKPRAWRWDTSPPWVAARDLPSADAERIAAALQEAGAEVQLR
jgi:hypothetical protein